MTTLSFFLLTISGVNRRKNISLLLAALLLIVLPASPSRAEETHIIQASAYGEIDWSAGVITTQGTDLEHARQNLWKLMSELRVDNQNRLDELVSHRGGLEEKLKALIQQLIPKKVKGTDTGKIMIELSLALNGALSEALINVQQVSSFSNHPVGVGPPEENPGPAGPKFMRKTTGIVVDARGLGVVPALYPQIFSEEGQLIYGMARVSRSYAVRHGLVKYLSDMTTAEVNERVGDNPKLIKAIELKPQAETDLIIGDKDSERIIRASNNSDFLIKCQLIIVIDPPQKKTGIGQDKDQAE
jgi:hypothetical protein